MAKPGNAFRDLIVALIATTEFNDWVCKTRVFPLKTAQSSVAFDTSIPM